MLTPGQANELHGGAVCAGGGAAYNCGPGSFRNGTLCTGTVTSDTQSCGGETSHKPHRIPTRALVVCNGGGASYNCSIGFFRTGSLCSGTDTSDSQTCNGTALSIVPHMDARERLKMRAVCTGDGAAYNCTSGRYRTGSLCDGTSFSNTQSCSGKCTFTRDGDPWYLTLSPDCSNSVDYQCGVGGFRSGTQCPGTQFADTQSCEGCARAFLRSPDLTHATQFALAVSDGTALRGSVRSGRSARETRPPTVRIAQVTTCTDSRARAELQPNCFSACNGGPSYNCGGGFYQTGLTCSGLEAADTQTCAGTSSGVCLLINWTCELILLAACNNGVGYNCSIGYLRNGASCSGFTQNDTQTCTECSGGANYNCTLGSYRVGTFCAGDAYDSQFCARTSPSVAACRGLIALIRARTTACEYGGLTYACGSGYYRSGTLCSGILSTDTQNCSRKLRTCTKPPSCDTILQFAGTAARATVAATASS